MRAQRTAPPPASTTPPPPPTTPPATPPPKAGQSVAAVQTSPKTPQPRTHRHSLVAVGIQTSPQFSQTYQAMHGETLPREGIRVPRSTTHEFEEAAQKCFSEELAAAMHRRLEVDVCNACSHARISKSIPPDFPGGEMEKSRTGQCEKARPKP